MKITRIQKDDFITTTWSGGKTEQIFIYPENADYTKRDFLLRVSTATVELERSEFTSLPSVKRIITPLSGKIKLFEKQPNNTEIKLANLKPFELYSFLGDTAIVSVGKCRDFNVMTKNKTHAELFCVKACEELSLKTNTFLFIFSYDAEGSILLLDEQISIGKFEFILISETEQILKLTNKTNKNILVGIVDF